MFESAPILWLQRFATSWLTETALYFNLLGYSDVHLAIVFGVIFGISFRKGVVLGQVLLWTELATDALKAFVALPRPSDVDRSITLIETGVVNLAPFHDRGAAGFFATLPADVVEFYRNKSGYDYGFPSGHVSAAAALWGGLWMMFRRRILLVIGAAMVFVAAIVRMYFGRHFLADVIGGALVGAAVVALAWAVLRLRQARQVGRDRPSMADAGLLLLPPLAALALPGASIDSVARLLGFGVAYLLIWRRGFPHDQAGVGRRLARVAVGLVSFLIVRLTEPVFERMLGGETAAADAVIGFSATGASLYLATIVNTRLRLFVE